VDGTVLVPGSDWSTYAWEPRFAALDPMSIAATDPMTVRSRTVLDDAYVVGGTLVGRASDPAVVFVLHLKLGGFDLRLRIHRPIVTGSVSPDRSTLTKATLAGVLGTDELLGDLKSAAKNLSVCESSVWEGLATQIRIASDVLTDGAQDPDRACDGISIALGFDARRSSLGPHRDEVPEDPGCGE
jgi:hypothetical protein